MMDQIISLPREICIKDPTLIAWVLGGDIFTALPYFGDSLLLAYVAWKRRKDLAWTNPLVLGFGAFIFLCGLGHYFASVVMFNPSYWWVYAWVGVARALVSVGVFAMLLNSLSTLLAVPTPMQLQQANEELRAATAIAMERLAVTEAKLRFERSPDLAVAADRLSAQVKHLESLRRLFNPTTRDEPPVEVAT